MAKYAASEVTDGYGYNIYEAGSPPVGMARAGQSFKIPTTNDVSRISLKLVQGGPVTDNVTIALKSGSLNGTNLWTTTIAGSSLPIGIGSSPVDFDFSPISLTGGVTYYIVVSRSISDGVNRPYWYNARDVVSPYTDGQGWQYVNGAWTGTDIYGTLPNTYFSVGTQATVLTSTIESKARVLPGSMYSYGSYATLPATNSTLANAYNSTDYTNAATIDSVFVNASLTNTYGIHQFASYSADTSSSINPQWVGKAAKNASSSPVTMQVYNVTDTVWETLATNTTAAPGDVITLNGSQSSNLSKYYDSNGYCYVRVYQ